MDMVRQVIQCDSDVSMLAARWVVQEDQPVNYIPEFSSTHMCRNYDDVLEVSPPCEAYHASFVLILCVVGRQPREGPSFDSSNP